MGEKRNAYRFLVGKLEGIRPVGKTGHKLGGGLKCILENDDGRAWTGFIWIKIRACGEVL
jgi:hypothetical protein